MARGALGAITLERGALGAITLARGALGAKTLARGALGSITLARGALSVITLARGALLVNVGSVCIYSVSDWSIIYVCISSFGNVQLLLLILIFDNIYQNIVRLSYWITKQCMNTEIFNHNCSHGCDSMISLLRSP